MAIRGVHATAYRLRPRIGCACASVATLNRTEKETNKPMANWSKYLWDKTISLQSSTYNLLKIRHFRKFLIFWNMKAENIEWFTKTSLINKVIMGLYGFFYLQPLLLRDNLFCTYRYTVIVMYNTLRFENFASISFILL